MNTFTIALLTSTNPADANDPVIDRVIFTGSSPDIDNAVNSQLVSWAEEFFDLSEQQLKDFKDDPVYSADSPDFTGNFNIIIEHDCRTVTLDSDPDSKHFLIAIKDQYVRDAQLFNGDLTEDIHENDIDWKDAVGYLVVMTVQAENSEAALKQAVAAGYKLETLILWQIKP